jgi:hypothetical protein
MKQVSRQPSGSTGGDTGAFLKPVFARARAARVRGGSAGAEAAE